MHNYTHMHTHTCVYPSDTFVCVPAQPLRHVQLFATPRTAARQSPLSMGFPRREYWSGLPFPTLGDLPDPGIEAASTVSSPALAGRFFTTELQYFISHIHIYVKFMYIDMMVKIENGLYFIIWGAMGKTQYSVIYVLYKIAKAITVANRKSSILSVHQLWLYLILH